MAKQITGKGEITDTDSLVGFVERQFYMLSNFSAHQIEVNGVLYPTLEHAYHAERFSTKNIKKEIQTASSPIKAKEISWKYKKDFEVNDWQSVKVDVMRKLCRLKLEQHDDVRDALLETGERQIVEDMESDDFWGIGKRLDGQNMLGKIWMELRAEIQNENVRNA